MLDLIPYDLRISPQYIAIFDALGVKYDWAEDKIDDVLAQTFISTATWGLELWEREFGIETDITKPLSERRSIILSKKRGVGTVTSEMIKSVAEAYYGGEVEVYESPGMYLVEIKFKSNLGVPPNLDDVYKSIKEIIPAHLELGFLFSYFLVRDIHKVMTINELQTQALDRFAGGGNVG